MLILIVTLLALLPALAILYPFLSKSVAARYADEDETSMAAELSRRWSSAISRPEEHRAGARHRQPRR